MEVSSHSSPGGAAAVPRAVQREILHQIGSAVDRLEIDNNTRDQKIENIRAEGSRSACQIKAIEAENLRRKEERYDLSVALGQAESKMDEQIKEVKSRTAGACKTAQEAADTAKEARLVATRASDNTEALKLDLAQVKSKLQKREYTQKLEEARQLPSVDNSRLKLWS
ncbi:hypothetical protein EST38_g12357 [Candolleomyces aberdarensis]|uniref:Uncharacterized protein n=1 Tax=Candolleomyces aberdarensis TaxID=2316362 RepID=A0A4Q2D3D9_9AGAR|nr:hypothetical protein EST38_g12357 [Candolleomyces aberdarensis]